MAFKIFVLLACFAVVRAGLIPAIAQPSVLAKSDENDPHPQYTFGYDVQDDVSGDSKNQYETRDGDVVRGQYSLIDADGLRRTVEYTADSVNGFNAIVRKESVGAAAKVAAPLSVIAATPAQLPMRSNGYSTPIAQDQLSMGQAGNSAIVKTTFSSPLHSYAY